MKKIISIILAIMFIGTAFCQENTEKKESTESVKPKVEFLLNLGLKNNQASINNLSPQLTDFERIDLYNTYKKSAVGPVLLNVFVGFGVGSYVSGDKLGGIIGTSLDTLSILVTLGSIGVYTSKLAEYESHYTKDLTNYQNDPLNKSYPNHNPPEYNPLIPIAFYIGSRIYEGIRANSYVKNYNKTLINSLGLNSFRTSLVPTITSDGNIAMAFNVSMMF